MFQWLIVQTVVTAAMAAAVAAACRFFRLGPAVRHLLWLVVLVKFLTPPIVCWPWTLPMHGPAPAPSTAGPPVAAVRTIIIDEAPIADVDPAVPGIAPMQPAAPLLTNGPAEAHPTAPAFSWDGLPAAAAWIWLASGAVVALRNAVRILRWRRRLARGLPAPEPLAELVRSLAASMGVRPPRLVVLSGAASPMIWAFGAPRLIWPLGLEDRLPAEGRRSVLLHELVHLRRRDHWIGWLLLVGGCVWWWHPLFWWVRRRLTQEAELACDAQVVGAAPDARRAYAEALLEVSQRLASTTALPALGAAAGRRDLERRLVMIMRGPAGRRSSWAALVSVGVLGLLALPAWTLGEDPRSAPPAAEPTLKPPPAVVDPFFGTPPTGFAPVAAPLKDTTVAPPADADREKKIADLEAKVEQLLRELRELRGQAPNPMPKPKPAPNDPGAGQGFVDYLLTPRPAPATAAYPAATPAGEAPAEVITLTRVSYKLKAETAAALASFLKDNVKTAILETKTEGENLTVTTTPEAQHAIGQFIRLIQGKSAMPSGMMGPGGGPFFTPVQPAPMGGIGATPPGAALFWTRSSRQVTVGFSGEDAFSLRRPLSYAGIRRAASRAAEGADRKGRP